MNCCHPQEYTSKPNSLITSSRVSKPNHYDDQTYHGHDAFSNSTWNMPCLSLIRVRSRVGIRFRGGLFFLFPIWLYRGLWVTICRLIFFVFHHLFLVNLFGCIRLSLPFCFLFIANLLESGGDFLCLQVILIGNDSRMLSSFFSRILLWGQEGKLTISVMDNSGFSSLTFDLIEFEYNMYAFIGR